MHAKSWVPAGGKEAKKASERTELAFSTSQRWGPEHFGLEYGHATQKKTYGTTMRKAKNMVHALIHDAAEAPGLFRRQRKAARKGNVHKLMSINTGTYAI